MNRLGGVSMWERLIRKGIDWRFPDEHGLYRKNLNCLQLCVKEILRSMDEPGIAGVFFHALRCTYADGRLITGEQPLQKGWRLRERQAEGRLRRHIQDSVDRDGYCLIRLEGGETVFSAYYGKFEVQYWTLALGYDKDYLLLCDEAGSGDFYMGQLGRIPWALVNDGPFTAAPAVTALVEKDGSEVPWQLQFSRAMSESVRGMTRQGGLSALQAYIDRLEQTPEEAFNGLMLDHLEYDIHHHKAVWHLWRTVLQQSQAAEVYRGERWMDVLMDVNKNWAMAVGVVMKWMKQPGKAYKSKLLHYLRSCLSLEIVFFLEMEGS